MTCVFTIFFYFRWFWSTLDPNKRVQYVCRTRLKKAKKTNFDDSDAHLVIDHETTEDKKAEKELNDMRIKLRQIEISKAKKSLSNILPPYAISSLWKNLKYQDLHEEDPKGKKSMPEKSRTGFILLNSVMFLGI